MLCSAGKTWDTANDESVEIRTITNRNIVGGKVILTVNSPLKHIHLCQETQGESFCGTVGLLSLFSILFSDFWVALVVYDVPDFGYRDISSENERDRRERLIK